MKRLLSLLAAVGLTVSTGTTVVACRNCPSNNPNLIDLGAIQFNGVTLPLPNGNQYSNQGQIDTINSDLQNDINSQIISAQQDFSNEFTTNLEELINIGSHFNNGDQVEMTITANSGSTVLTGSNTILVTLKNQTLGDVFGPYTDLGFFDEQPDEAAIRARFEELFPNLDLGADNIELVFPTPPNGTVTANANPNGVYTGSATLTYEVSEALDVIVTNTDLGLFNATPTETEILNAVNTNNSLDIQSSQVTIGTPSNGTVIMTANSNPAIPYHGSVTLTYAVRRQLNAIVQNTNLGYMVQSPPSTNDILTAVNEKNPGLDIQASDVTIQTPTEGQVIMTAVDGGRFLGSVNLTYELAQQLDAAIVNKDLGFFNEDPNATQVIAAINSKNPGLNIQANEVTIGTASGGTVTATAVEGSRFQNSADLTYQISEELTSAITTTNLGYLNQDPNLAQTVAAINAKNPGLNLTEQEITINTASGGTVTATGVTGSRFQGSVDLTYEVSEQLSLVVTVKNLGYFPTDPDATQVLDAVNAKNPSLNILSSEVTIGTATGGTVVMTGVNGTRFQGNVTLTYQIAQQLSAAITTKALGSFSTDPDATQVLTAVNSKNPGLNIQTSEVTIGTATGGTVTITAANTAGNRFQGSANLTYTVTSQDLGVVVTNKALGFFNADPNATQVLAAVNANNSGLNIQASEVTIGTASGGAVTMTAVAGGRFTGSANLTYTIAQQIDGAIVNKALGFFNTDPTSTQVLNAINAENSGLNLLASEVTIGAATGGTVSVTANANTRFQGTTSVTYDISEQLSAAITIKNLGFFDTDPTATQVLAAINDKNPGLNIQASEITIGAASGGQVTVTANAGTRFQGTANLTYEIAQELSVAIVVKNLGYLLYDPFITDAVNAINDVNPGLNLTPQEITINIPTSGEIVATAVEGSRFQGTANLTYAIAEELTSAVTVTALGYLPGDPDLDQTVAAINAKNPGLNITNQEITINTATGGSVTATAVEGSRFQGSVSLTYEVSAQLSVAIATKNLGNIVTAGATPTLAEIVTAINAANAGLNITAQEITMGTPTTTAVTVTAVSGSRFQGSANLTYQIAQALSVAISTPNLGYILAVGSVPTLAEIVIGINAKNPGLNIQVSEITMGTPTATAVTITAVSGSRFKGTLNLTYQISQNLVSLVTIPALGLVGGILDSVILAALNLLNGLTLQLSVSGGPGVSIIDINTVGLNGTAKLVDGGSGQYHGVVELTFLISL